MHADFHCSRWGCLAGYGDQFKIVQQPFLRNFQTPCRGSFPFGAFQAHQPCHISLTVPVSNLVLPIAHTDFGIQNRKRIRTIFQVNPLAGQFREFQPHGAGQTPQRRRHRIGGLIRLNGLSPLRNQPQGWQPIPATGNQFLSQMQHASRAGVLALQNVFCCECVFRHLRKGPQMKNPFRRCLQFLQKVAVMLRIGRINYCRIFLFV